MRIEAPARRPISDDEISLWLGLLPSEVLDVIESPEHIERARDALSELGEGGRPME
jgi:hypothetical protein